MSDRLLLRIASDGGLTWLRQVGGARASGASAAGPPPESAVEAAGEIVVFVPSEDVLLTSTQLTARNRAQLLQALPFAIEDQLLSPVDALHFAAAQGSADPIGVAVVAKGKLNAWLAQLRAAGIRPDVLVPDALALPMSDQSATLLIEGARATVRLAPWSAFACSVDELPHWLALARAPDSPTPLDVHDFRDAPALALPAPIGAYRERQHDTLAFLGANFAVPPLNLLDGPFAADHRQARGTRWWRIAAALAAAIVILAVANLGVDVVQLSRTSARMDTLAREAVRGAFPDIDATQLARLGPEQLMRGRLARIHPGGESSGILRVLAQIAPVLGTTTRIQTRGMEYRNGTFELALRAPDVAALDSVRERLAATPGLKAEVTVANPGADGVDGRIRITGGAP
ncbi:MAG: type II secretion system protein GspL [Dokdonella sp.]